MKQEKKNDVAVLLDYAGSRRGLTFLGLALSALSMLFSMVYFVKCFSQKSERKIPNLRNGIFPYISRKHFHMIMVQSVA